MKLLKDTAYEIYGECKYNKDIDEKQHFWILGYMETDTLFKSANSPFVWVANIISDKYIYMMRFGGNFALQYNGVYDINEQALTGYWDQVLFEEIFNPIESERLYFKILSIKESDDRMIKLNFKDNSRVKENSVVDLKTFKKYIKSVEDELKDDAKEMYDYFLQNLEIGLPSAIKINEVLKLNQEIYELKKKREVLLLENSPVRKLTSNIK